MKNNNSHLNIGVLGEDLVSFWLKSQGWHFLHQRWSCRFGEIDLIFLSGEKRENLIFIEVKTRSRNNLDQNGLLAITPQKQNKLHLTAEIFLSENPDFSNLYCRFDVACVRYEKLKNLDYENPVFQADKRSLFTGKYKLQIQDYIRAAF